MPQLTFRNFSDLAFIQSIDKPKYLAPLLRPHREFFLRQEVDIDGLRNGDATDRKLLRVFTDPDEQMPPELLHDLYMLDDLADENGHDRILAEADRQRVSLESVKLNLNPAEFAITVFRERRGLLEDCHDKTLYRKVKNYMEFQSEKGRRLGIEECRAKVKQLKSRLGAWFETKDRSPACEIYVYEEASEIRFLITHGRLLRTDGTIDKSLRRGRVAYRPQQHDSVVYDNQRLSIRVNAQTWAEKDLYRETFGEVFFEEAGHFPGESVYTLEPLRTDGYRVSLCAGVESAVLAEVWIEIDDYHRFTQISRATDLLDRRKACGRPNLSEGRIVRAAFIVKYKSGGRGRKLEIRPPNIAIYDRERDGEAAEGFLQANAFFDPKSQRYGRRA